MLHFHVQPGSHNRLSAGGGLSSNGTTTPDEEAYKVLTPFTTHPPPPPTPFAFPLKRKSGCLDRDYRMLALLLKAFTRDPACPSLRMLSLKRWSSRPHVLPAADVCG